MFQNASQSRKANAFTPQIRQTKQADDTLRQYALRQNMKPEDKATDRTLAAGKSLQLKSKQTKEDHSREIPAHHASVELIAHHVAYLETLSAIPEATRHLLLQWGYNPDRLEIIDGCYGFNMAVLHPLANSEVAPVVAFRGSSETLDWVSDLADPSPGYYQFMYNQKLIQSTFAGLKQKALVTGHSLGGALAQYAALTHAGKISEVVTFQSPGIDSAMAARFDMLPEEERPTVTHHLANNDVVDNSGDQHIRGDIYMHHLKDFINPVKAHTSYLFSTPNFKEVRELMQIPDNWYEQVAGQNLFEERFFIEKFQSHPEPIRKAIVEAIRKAI